MGDTEAYDTYQYLLPNGFGLAGKYRHNEYLDFPYLRRPMLNITTNRENRQDRLKDESSMSSQLSWDPISFAKNGSKLINVFAVGAYPGTLPTQPPGDYESNPHDKYITFAKPIAFECMLQYCIRTMRAEIISGILHEHEISTWVNDSQIETHSLEDIYLQFPNSREKFRIDAQSHDGIGVWLSRHLTGNVTVQNYLGGDSPQSEPEFSSVTIEGIYRAMNHSADAFPGLMNNLANSLSQQLRTLRYQTPLTGNAFTASSRAVVRWEWLTLPIVELVGSLALLIIVLIETRKHHLHSWSFNVLALFFHGLDERPVDGGIHGSQKAMQQGAKKMFVEFRPREEGGRLVILHE